MQPTAQQLELFFQCSPQVSTNADGSLTVRPGRVRRVAGTRMIGVKEAQAMVPHLPRRTVQRIMAAANAGQRVRGGKRWISPEAWAEYCRRCGLMG